MKHAHASAPDATGMRHKAREAMEEKAWRLPQEGDGYCLKDHWGNGQEFYSGVRTGEAPADRYPLKTTRTERFVSDRSWMHYGDIFWQTLWRGGYPSYLTVPCFPYPFFWPSV